MQLTCILVLWMVMAIINIVFHFINFVGVTFALLIFPLIDKSICVNGEEERDYNILSEPEFFGKYKWDNINYDAEPEKEPDCDGSWSTHVRENYFLWIYIAIAVLVTPYLCLVLILKVRHVRTLT